MSVGVCVQQYSVQCKGYNLIGVTSVESLQSHMILTMSHWSSGLTCLLPATRVTGSNPLGGYLCETGILLLALSRYIGDPDVIDHQQGFVPNNCH